MGILLVKRLGAGFGMAGALTVVIVCPFVVFPFAYCAAGSQPRALVRVCGNAGATVCAERAHARLPFAGGAAGSGASGS